MRRSFSLGLALSFAALWAPEAAAQQYFHAPSTSAEIALDQILWRAAHDTEMSAYALNMPERNKTNDREYARLLTTEYTSAVAALQKKMVEENCDGEYDDEEVCGFEANPITCRVDSAFEHGFMYATTNVKKRAVTIAVVPIGQGEQYAVNTYKMIYVGRAWKIDGVNCFGEVNFNMK